MAEKRKRRISKCECCPYFAKNHEKGKWECSLTIKYLGEKDRKSCIFDKDKWASENGQEAIIERWLKANE